MTWLSRLTGNRGTHASVEIAGKPVQVFCTASATKALAHRATPLVVEIEIAFACFARKRVRFHETVSGGNIRIVNDKITLLFTTVVPESCAPSSKPEAASPTVRSFFPKSVRIDRAKGAWVGDFEL